jgi:hypothetical protein
MALGSTQPLTEMSTRNLPGGKERPAHKAVYLFPFVSSANIPFEVSKVKLPSLFLLPLV